MNYANAYALLARNLNSEKDAERLLRLMKKRGHLSLLPRVVHTALRGQKPKETLTVANEGDISQTRARFPEATVIVDTNLIRGFVHRRGTTITDTSLRSRLASLYQKTIGIT